MDVISALRLFYLATTLILLAVYAVPGLHSYFLAYGARGSSDPSSAKKATPGSPSTTQSTAQTPRIGVTAIHRLVHYLGEIKVPHSWFTQFYVLSVALSMVWQHQLVTKGVLFRMIAERTDARTHSMSLNQVALCWCLMAFQGSRRLYECIIFLKPTQSKMWFVHWLLGYLYYTGLGIAIWIEGIGVLQSTSDPFGDMTISAPSLRDVVYVSVFIVASCMQYIAHKHLASLEKYTLPSHPAFASTVCPHYTAECAIYVALAFLAAPQGQFVNQTLFTVLLFVVVNLGISADLSRKWAIKKFGDDPVASRWRMIPGVW